MAQGRQGQTTENEMKIHLAKPRSLRWNQKREIDLRKPPSCCLGFLPSGRSISQSVETATQRFSMSIKVMSQVWDYSKAKGSTLLLLLAIADHCHDDGTGAWPSLRRLAMRTRQTKRNTQLLLRELQDIGELKVNYGGGPNGVNTYEVLTEGGEKISPHENQRTKSTLDFMGGMKTISPDPSVNRQERRRESHLPSLKEVLGWASMIGLAPWKAEDWFDEMEGNGWLDFQHRPVRKWQNILNRVKRKWEADGRPMSPPVNGAYKNKAKNLSVLDIKTIIAAKQAECDRLKSHHCAEGPLSADWDNPSAKARFFELKKGIKTLNAELASMA